MIQRWLITTLFIFLFVSTLRAESGDHFKRQDYDAAYRAAYIADKVDKKPSIIDLNILGKIYLKGLGASEKDTLKAKMYLDKAILKGSSASAVLLAKEYETGKNLKRNLVLALQYYKKAADLGEKNLEPVIATIATKISGGTVNESSCPEIILAANKKEIDFFILAAKCFALANKQENSYSTLLQTSFEHASYKDSNIVLDLLTDHKQKLFSPALAFKFVASMDETNSDLQQKYFDHIFKKIEGKYTKADLSRAIKVLEKAYLRDKEMSQEIVKLLTISILDRSREISDTAIEYVVNDMKSSFRPDTEMKIFAKLLQIDAISKDAKKQIQKRVNNKTIKFLDTNSGNLADIENHVRSMRNAGLCMPAKMMFEQEHFQKAIKFAELILKGNRPCVDGEYKNIVDGFSGWPRYQGNHSVQALKNMCSDGSKNSCYALGAIYKGNNIPALSKSDSKEYALAAFDTGVRSGSADAALELSLHYSKKGQKKKALSYANTAYEQGLLEGLYAQAEVKLATLFSSGKESCQPLLKFLSVAKINNPYYERAKALKKKKSC